MEPTAARPLRADAVRNRAKILDAARQQITAHGSDVGMDDIATAAGVAVGTLYRHFPTKTDLVAAVVSEYLSQVADRAEVAAAEVVDGSPAFVELTELLREIVIATATNQAAKAAADSLNAEVSDSAVLQRAGAALQSIIDAAAVEKTVRADLSLDDFYLLINSVPAGQSEAVLDRWVELALFGISGRTIPN